MKVIPQTHAGAVGTSVTLGAGFASRIVELTPLLQGISLIVSILVGLLTAGWYVYKFLVRNRK